MITQIILCSTCVLMLANIGLAVVRPDVYRQQKSPPVEPSVKSANVSHDVVSTEHKSTFSHVTAQYCCKVGESLVRKLNTCRPEATLRTNTLVKGKWSFRRKTSAILSTELRRCKNQQHVILKCCALRLEYVRALNACKMRRSTIEQRKCRRNARNQYGFRSPSAR